MSGDEPPGWYGKLAMLGDFASRRLAPDWVASCDRWLAACMQASRHALGDAWLPLYLAAPVWRFAWGPGVVDERWWFGALVPSCDNVGRYFPLLLAHPRAHAPADRIALLHLEQWWSHLARAAMATLADGATLEAFEEALAQSPPWPGSLAPPTRPQTAPAGHESHAVAAGATLTDIASSIAAAGLQRRLAGTSFWWPWADGDVAGACTLMPGLPSAEAFATMLRGTRAA